MEKEDRKKLAEEKRRIRKNNEKILAALEKDDIRRVQFQNLEGGPAAAVPLEFTYENVKKYILLHNGIYDLPVSVIRWIRQRCRVPIYKQYDEVEVAGELRADPVNPEDRIKGYTSRFALIPVEDEAEAA